MKTFHGPEFCRRIRLGLCLVILAVTVVILNSDAFAQKAPVDLGFEVTSTTRQQLQSVPIAVEVRSQKNLPYLAASSSAAASGTKPETVTAINMKKNETARFEEKLLLSGNLTSYLSVALSSKEKRLDEFRTPATVDIPVSHSGSTVKFGKPVIAKVQGEEIVSNTKVQAIAVEAPTMIEGYKSIARFSLGVQKAGLQLSSRRVAKLDVNVGTDGGVSVLSEKPLFKSIPLSNDPVVEEVPFAIALGERGKIVGQVVAKDAAGNVLYGRRTILYVVSDQRKLYTGISSFLDLDIQKLKDDLQEGLIKQDQYEKQLTLLLSGKVTESN